MPPPPIVLLSHPVGTRFSSALLKFKRQECKARSVGPSNPQAVISRGNDFRCVGSENGNVLHVAAKGDHPNCSNTDSTSKIGMGHRATSWHDMQSDTSTHNHPIQKKDLHNIITPQDCRLLVPKETLRTPVIRGRWRHFKNNTKNWTRGFFPPHHCPKRWQKIACQGHWPGPIPSGTSTLISWVWPSIAIALRKTPGKETPGSLQFKQDHLWTLARFQQQEHDSIFAAPTSNPLVLQDIELKLKLHWSNLVFCPASSRHHFLKCLWCPGISPTDSMTKRLTWGDWPCHALRLQSVPNPWTQANQISTFSSSDFRFPENQQIQWKFLQMNCCKSIFISLQSKNRTSTSVILPFYRGQDTPDSCCCRWTSRNIQKKTRFHPRERCQTLDPLS